jgi:MEDS: MEthanogen/methylotroph, DcmR Sensory domain/STAS domain
LANATSVDRLSPGDHACLTFSDEEERLDIVAAFVRDGLSAGQRVLCYTAAYQPAELHDRLADRGVPAATGTGRGQLDLRPAQSWLAGAGFLPSRVLGELSGAIDQARIDGYGGLRVAADMGWAADPVVGVEHLVTFEKQVSQLFADARVTAVCQYDRQQFDAVTLASTTAVHSCAVAATVYHDDPVLRICRQHSPGGIRVSGELDYTNLDVFRDALGEAVRLGEHVHVNLGRLRFIDAASAGALVQSAATLPAGRTMTVMCRRLVCTVLRHMGAQEVTALHLQAVPGES